jgi:hypothetical protein
MTRWLFYIAFFLSLVSNYFLCVRDYNLDMERKSVANGYYELAGKTIGGKPLFSMLKPESMGIFRLGPDLLGCFILKPNWDGGAKKWVR